MKAGQRALACPGCLKRGVTLRPGPEDRFVCRFCDWTAESNGHTPIDVRRRRSLRTFNETHPDRPAG